MATGDQNSQGRAPGAGTIDGTLKGAAAGTAKPKDRVDTSVKRLNEGLRSHDAARAQKSRPSTPPYEGPPKAVAGSTTGSSSRPSQAPSTNEELEFVNAQVKAAESEVEAARARAEAAKLQLDTVKGRSELLQEQLDAARGQVEAAQAQARAAEAQHEAATVQAEAAIAQAEVCKEQHESLKTELLVMRAQAAAYEEQGQTLKEQLGLMRSQAETLEEQLAVMRRQARGTGWLAALTAVASLSVAALAGVAVLAFLQLSGGAPFGPARPAADTVEPAAPQPAQPAPGEGEAQGELSGQLEPLQSEQQRTTEAVTALATRLDRVAARVADGGGAAPVTDRVSLTSPPFEGKGLAWNAAALQQWLAKAAAGPQPGEPRSRFDLAGTVRRPFKRPARVTVDVFEDQWWPAGGALEVATNGSFGGSILVDPARPPSKIKVTLWELGDPATRLYEIAAPAGPTTADGPEQIVPPSPAAAP